MELDEDIEICDYNPAWTTWYDEESTLLCSVFGPNARLEHFGSTSIPGMVAKPIVDILIGISYYPTIPPSQVKQLEQLGYECLGMAGVPGRIYFRKRGVRSFNLAVTQYKSDLWRNNLLLRDFLRSDKNEAQLYAQHKISIYDEGHRTLLAYSNHKSEFILQLLQRAKNS